MGATIVAETKADSKNNKTSSLEKKFLPHLCWNLVFGNRQRVLQSTDKVLDDRQYVLQTVVI